jgi:hypothetical protein
VPRFAVSVLPTLTWPLIDGRELFDGAAAEREPTAPAAPTATSAENAAATSMRERRIAEGRRRRDD